MVSIASPNGTTYDTRDVPAEWDSVYCGKCGSRMGWHHPGHAPQPYPACDDCIADIANGEVTDDVR